MSAAAASSWRRHGSEAFAAIADRLRGLEGGKIAAIAGDLCDAESMVALKDLMTGLGSPHIDCRQDGARLEGGPRGSYIFNPGVRGIEQADAILLIGTNPRWESPVLNARIRKRYLHGRCPIASIGPAVDLTYPVERLGAGPATLRELVDGKVGFMRDAQGGQEPADHRRHGRAGACRRCGGAGAGAGARGGASAPFATTGTALPSCIPRRRVSAASISAWCRAKAAATSKASSPAARRARSPPCILLGADEIDTGRFGKAFVVYQGHHGDAGAHRADVVLPGAAYTEKPGTYVNTEGRVQLGQRAVYPPGDAREDWTILRALSERLGKTLPYDTLAQVRGAAGGREPQLRRARPAGAGRLGRVRAAGSDRRGAIRPRRSQIST